MKYALAIMDIKPWEFWELTLAEFNVAMEAYIWKKEQEEEQREVEMARHAIWTMLPHMKKLPEIKDLIGGDDEDEAESKSKTSKEDYERMKARMTK